MYMYCMQIQNTPLEINETVKKDIYLLAEISFDKFISSQLAMHSLMKWTHAILCLWKCQWTVLHPLSLFTEQASGGTEHIISPNQGIQIRTAYEVVRIRNAWLGKMRTHQYCDILSLRMRNLVASQHSSYGSASREFETNLGAKVLKRFNPCIYKTLKYIL